MVETVKQKHTYSVEPEIYAYSPSCTYSHTLVTLEVHTPEPSEAYKNQYVFCANNPVNFTDPSGLAPRLWAVDSTGRGYYSPDIDWGNNDSRWGGRGAGAGSQRGGGGHSGWNPSGHARVLGGSHIGGYHGGGAEKGVVTLLFDNGYAQRYHFTGGGAGFGDYAISVTMGGHAYGVYHPSDFEGSFANVSLGWWNIYGWPGGSGGWSWEVGLPGINGSYQGYWTTEPPYKYEDECK